MQKEDQIIFKKQKNNQKSRKIRNEQTKEIKQSLDLRDTN